MTCIRKSLIMFATVLPFVTYILWTIVTFEIKEPVMANDNLYFLYLFDTRTCMQNTSLVHVNEYINNGPFCNFKKCSFFDKTKQIENYSTRVILQSYAILGAVLCMFVLFLLMLEHECRKNNKLAQGLTIFSSIFIILVVFYMFVPPIEISSRPEMDICSTNNVFNFNRNKNECNFKLNLLTNINDEIYKEYKTIQNICPNSTEIILKTNEITISVAMMPSPFLEQKVKKYKFVYQLFLNLFLLSYVPVFVYFMCYSR